MADPEKYMFEEYRVVGSFWAWMILIGLSLLLVFTGIVVHGLIPDKERHWDYGALQTVPGSSIYFSISPDPQKVRPDQTKKIPQQIQPRPGAKPLEKLPPKGYEREKE